MKYLIKYKLFENHSDIISEAEDILLELEDSGFKIIISSPVTSSINVIIKREEFGWIDVRDVVDRLCNHLKYYGYVLLIGYGKIESYQIFDPVSWIPTKTTRVDLKFFSRNS